jgi:hypothetical protein
MQKAPPLWLDRVKFTIVIVTYFLVPILPLNARDKIVMSYLECITVYNLFSPQKGNTIYYMFIT